MITTRQKATLRIRVDQGEAGSRITFTHVSTGQEVTLSSDWHSEKWGHARAKWRKTIETFSAMLRPVHRGILDRSGSAGRRSLRFLREQGRLLMRDMCHEDAAWVRAQELITLAIPGASTLDYDVDGFVNGRTCRRVYPALVEVSTTHDEVFPWELLPLLPLRGSEDMQRIGRCFLGFVAVVRRVIRNARVASSGSIENAPAMPVTYYSHGKLDGNYQELRFLEQLPHIDVRKWGATRVPGRRSWTAKLALSLVERDRIHHFSGHGSTWSETGRRALNDPVLELTPFTRPARRFTLSKLDVALESEGQSQKPDPEYVSRSLVFLNLCGSSQVHPKSSVSFPYLFLSHGHSACIGTEAQVADAFAAAFAQRFYTLFLHHTSDTLHALPLGESLLLAKWHFLRLYKNPQGLLYTLHGDPEIRVRSGSEWCFPA